MTEEYPKIEWSYPVPTRNFHRAHQGDEQRRRDQQLIHEQLLKGNGHFREAREKSLSEMEEMKRFQSSTFDTRRKLVEDRVTILEFSSGCRNYRMKSIG